MEGVPEAFEALPFVFAGVEAAPGLATDFFAGSDRFGLDLEPK